MKPIVLLKDGARYKGEYVALNNANERKVLCHGENIEEVMNKAIEKGVKEPVMVFVPKKNVTYIY